MAGKKQSNYFFTVDRLTEQMKSIALMAGKKQSNYFYTVDRLTEDQMRVFETTRDKYRGGYITEKVARRIFAYYGINVYHSSEVPY